MNKIFAALALFAAGCSVAYAATFFAQPVYGVRYAPMSSVPDNCKAGSVCTYLKASSGNLTVRRADGYDQDLTNGGGQIMFSPTEYANARAATIGSGNFSVATKWLFNRQGTIYGLRFYWNGTSGKSIKCSLWDPSNVRQRTQTVTVTTAGIYTCTFSTSFQIPSANVGGSFYAAVWDTSGVQFAADGIASPLGFPTLAGPSLVYQGSTFIAGDNQPTTLDSTSTYPVDPVFTVP